MSSDDRTADESGVVDIMRTGEETGVIKRLGRGTGMGCCSTQTPGMRTGKRTEVSNV
jgi:hypothetical protein